MAPQKLDAILSDEEEDANTHAIAAALSDPPKRAKIAGVNERPGVVYLGRIPHGFYENQMRAYFSQFGEINRLRLSRNRKTGASRHYAFIEFASQEVASIVAETMHNYLLLGHLLQCHKLEEAQIHPRMWLGASRRLQTVPSGRIARDQCNRVELPASSAIFVFYARIQEKSAKDRAKIGRRLKRQDSRKRMRLAQEGIEYDFYGHAAKE